MNAASRTKPAPGRRVLVIDDNVDQVRSMALLVKMMGHEVDYAINAIAGLEMANRVKPEVLVLDINLPDASGFDVARQLRRNPELRKLRIIGITGANIDPESARIAGFDDLLLKPVDPAALERLLAL